jgi:hypothetical protein
VYKKHYITKTKDESKSREEDRNNKGQKRKEETESGNSFDNEFGRQFNEFNHSTTCRNEEDVDEIGNFLIENGSHDQHMNYNSEEYTCSNEEEEEVEQDNRNEKRKKIEEKQTNIGNKKSKNHFL